jgi:hypothetical protein
MPADQPISLSDEALTAVCQMCRPLTAPARSAFLEALALALAGEPRPAGDGAVFRHARALLRSGRFELAAEYLVDVATRDGVEASRYRERSADAPRARS